MISCEMLFNLCRTPEYGKTNTVVKDMNVYIGIDDRIFATIERSPGKASEIIKRIKKRDLYSGIGEIMDADCQVSYHLKIKAELGMNLGRIQYGNMGNISRYALRPICPIFHHMCLNTLKGTSWIRRSQLILCYFLNGCSFSSILVQKI